MVWLLALTYVCVLLFVSRLTSGKATNDTFFRGERRSPWLAVAFGMLGASLSGVTFVSVPAMVRASGMTYLQMCLGFVPGYILVALVLLPVYYRLRLTTIYTFLNERFGPSAYRSGSAFFIISKVAGAGVRLFLVCTILHTMLFGALGVPFGITALLTIFLIWLYTRRGGIKTLVWTDCAQTAVLLAALVMMLRAVLRAEGWTLLEAWDAVSASPMSRAFVFDDWSSPRHFVKQFLSGVFIVVVMTGLDQDMMQKNLTCRTLREAQKNMILNGLMYLPINILFLGLGVLLYTFAASQGIALPDDDDSLLPTLAGGGYLGRGAQVCFVVGITAAALSSADSALTALTTSVTVDFLHRDDDERLRRRVHVAVAVVLLAFIMLLRVVGTGSVINAVYVVASYTYGPLLGLFGLGLFTRRVQPAARAVPVVCVLAPVLCYLLSLLCLSLWDYHFGYELLLLNGTLTALALWLSANNKVRVNE